MGADAAALRKVNKLLALQKDYIEKALALSVEIDQILGGGASIGEQLKALETAFSEAWCQRYAPGDTAKRYVWNYAQDRAQFKRLLKNLTVDELSTRMGRYLRDDEPFYVRGRHPFALFVRNVNAYANAPVPVNGNEGDELMDDVAATRKRLAATRGTAF